jgi:hypothetical protein
MASAQPLCVIRRAHEVAIGRQPAVTRVSSALVWREGLDALQAHRIAGTGPGGTFARTPESPDAAVLLAVVETTLTRPTSLVVPMGLPAFARGP